MHTNKRLLEILIVRMIRKRNKRSLYIRDIFRKRVLQGEMQLVNELSTDSLYHHMYFRMSKESFDYLLNRIGFRIGHSRNHSYPIHERLRLAITLRYLAAGSSQISLAFNYRVSPSSISCILRETLAAIWDELHAQLLPILDKNGWKQKAEEYEDLWNFPHCCGALDGKHIRVKNFRKGGSQYYNYKKYFSILLLISADAKYKITVCDIGASGSESDIGVLESSVFGDQLFNNTLPLPTPKCLPTSEKICPYIFVGDGGFPLKKNLMRPFPMDRNLTRERKIFNYRLSRARRVSENAFGIMAARLRIFYTQIGGNYDLAVSIVKASVVLHNFFMEQSDLFELTPDVESQGEIVLGTWREITRRDSGYTPVTRVGSNNYQRDADEIRKKLMGYFCDEYPLSWQEEHVQRGS